MAEHELYFADEKAMRSWKIKHVISQVILYAFLVLVAIFILIPFYWMIITSLKNDAEMELMNPTLFPTYEIAWQNYAVVFNMSIESTTGNGSFVTYFANTIWVSMLTTLAVVFTSIGAGFAFARLEFKGKNAVFAALLGTMMIPGEMMVITNYMTVSVYGWMNTFFALVLPFAVSVFYIYFLRQTFMQIPNELYLAAKVDGVGDFKYLVKVMVPIAMPAITTIIILSSMGAWNAYIWPQLVANQANMRLVANGLMEAFTSEFGSQKNIQLAASTVVTAPLFIFFCVFRKYIMKGVSRSGIKG